MSAKVFATAALLVLTGCATAVPEESRITSGQQWAAQCEDWDDWDKPGPAFLVHGSTYYVGTCGIASILIADGLGHFVIDGGTRAGADVIAANIASAGYDVRDVSILLHSHEHFDHVGGLAELQRRSGAVVFASPAAAPVLATGIAAEEDPQFGILDAFEPVVFESDPPQGIEAIPDEMAHPLYGQNVELMPISTPGHTAGALTWQWQSCYDAGECLSIVYADSLSPVSADDYRFSDHPEYVEAYRAGLERLAALDCDILLTPHPSASGMRDKLLAGDLTSGMNCADYAASITERLDARLAEEAQGNP